MISWFALAMEDRKSKVWWRWWSAVLEAKLKQIKSTLRDSEREKMKANNNVAKHFKQCPSVWGDEMPRWTDRQDLVQNGYC